MMLVLLVFINNEGKAVIGAAALLSRELTETYQWFFSQVKSVIPKLNPKIIMTDGFFPFLFLFWIISKI